MKLLPCLLLIAVTPAVNAEDKTDPTKDGGLTVTLTIKDVQGGFAGFTGTQWTVEPSGKWTVSQVFNKRLTEKAKGQLSKEQLAELVKQLEKYDLKGLKSKEAGKPMANPHVVTISLGVKDVALTLGAGEALPKPDPDKPTASIEGRFSGIVGAVTLALKEK